METIYFEPIIKEKSRNNNETLPWVEKFRPGKLDDVLSHEHIISMLRVYIEKHTFPHLLFYGPPGTGKTSTILATARQMYGTAFQFMVLIINASAQRGIEAVRNQIHKFVTTDTTYFGKTYNKFSFKLVILDETDAMTHDAQALLRKVVEMYTSNARFCLICNYIEKIIPALQSRCTIFRFAPLSQTSIIKRLNEIADSENLNLIDDGCTSIIDHSGGDMRKVVNILQSVSMAYDVINEHNINQCLGYPQREHIDIIVSILVNETYATCYKILHNMITDEGISLDDIICELEKRLRKSIIDTDSESELRKLPLIKKASILSHLRSIEINQATNSSDKIQMCGLIGIFKKEEFDLLIERK